MGLGEKASAAALAAVALAYAILGAPAASASEASSGIADRAFSLASELDEAALKQWVVAAQDVPADTSFAMPYELDSDGNEFDSLTDAGSIDSKWQAGLM